MSGLLDYVFVWVWVSLVMNLFDFWNLFGIFWLICMLFDVGYGIGWGLLNVMWMISYSCFIGCYFLWLFISIVGCYLLLGVG